MQLSPVKVTYALCCLLCGRHGDKPIAASTRALGIGHHLGTNNLKRMIPTWWKWGKKSNIKVKGTKILVTTAKDVWTNLAVFAEERLQISCPGGWGQAADPQVLACCSSSSTPSSYMQDKNNEQTLTDGWGHWCALKSHLLTLFVFGLSLMIFSLRTTDRKIRSYKHSSGDTGDI